MKYHASPLQSPHSLTKSPHHRQSVLQKSRRRTHTFMNGKITPPTAKNYHHLLLRPPTAPKILLLIHRHHTHHLYSRTPQRLPFSFPLVKKRLTKRTKILPNYRQHTPLRRRNHHRRKPLCLPIPTTRNATFSSWRHSERPRCTTRKVKNPVKTK
jgi:hypothetical protein